MSDARRRTLLDLLVPAAGPHPAFTAADPDESLIARVLRIRPELAGVVERALSALPPDPGPADLDALAAREPGLTQALLELVLGAYYLSPAVRAAIGYDGQQALSLPRDGFGAEDLALELMASPPRWRDPRLLVQDTGSRTASLSETAMHAYPARHVTNPLARRAPYGERERAVLNRAAGVVAAAEITSWPGYAPTPLVPLPGLAARLGLGAILYKDEGRRFGLRSFKALGGAYAVLRILQAALARDGIAASAADLVAGRHRDRVAGITVATATDGNHGRSVAWGAGLFGCRSVVYIHEGVSREREEAIAAYGAEMRRVPGGYDDSVRAVARDAAANGWSLVADTSAEGGRDVPMLVMQGYTLIAEEVLAAEAGAPPLTHVFVQAGVGGLAAALAAHFWETLGPARPRLVVVEPILADCVFRTVEAGRPVVLEGSTDTFMACLAAGEVSPVAWEVLEGGLDDVLALPDEAAMDAMRLLAAGTDGDPPIVAGESGAAAAAGLVAAGLDPDLKARLGLDAASRVLVIGSEGATDPATYERVVGRPAEAVAP